MSIVLNGTTGVTTPDVTSDGSLKIDASAPDDSLVVNASGNVGIGTSSPSRLLQLNSGLPVLQFTNPTTGTTSNDGTLLYQNGANFTIEQQDSGFINVFTSGSERARIDSSGNLLVGCTQQPSTTIPGLQFSASASGTQMAWATNTTANKIVINMTNPNGQVGYILTNGSSTTYATSSDYRLKENVVGVTGASARVQQLNPVRFNFIADPDRTVDGFLAHEVQDVVPEAITGAKDAIDDEGNPVYQGIDQSKLVPLLTAALQEALAKIDDLTARVSALEAV